MQRLMTSRPSSLSSLSRLGNQGRRGSMGSRNVGCEPSISRFTTNSLSTKSFRWLHSEAWNDEHLDFFLRERPSFRLRAFAPLPYVTGRKQIPPELAGRWVLEAPHQEPPRAWAEIQSYQTSFTTIHMLVSAWHAKGSHGGWLEPVAAEALALMISGVAIMTSADVILLIPASQQVEIELAQLDLSETWSPAKTIWSPTSELAALKQIDNDQARLLEPLRCLQIDPHAWWTTSRGEVGKRTLAYLERRRATADELNNSSLSPYKRKRKSIFSRLLRR